MRIFFVVIITFIHILASANIYPPKFVHYTNVDGLSSSYVKGIIQDKYGFIWVATRENITRFEGNRFVEFPAYDVLNNNIEIEPQSISCINDSLILVESMQNFYYYFDYNNECFKPYTPLYDNSKKDCIMGTSDDNAIFIQYNSIRSLNLSDKNISYADIFTDIQQKTPLEKFIKLASNKQIIVTYTSLDRLLVYNRTTKKTSLINTKDINHRDINFMKIDKHNNIWIGVYSSGLVKINYATGQQELLSTDSPIKLPHNMVHCIAFDKTNRVWIGTENGLCIYNESTNEFKNFKYDRSNPEGLNTTPIYNAFADKEGNIWLGTYFGGINLWCDKPSKFTHWKPGTAKTHLGGKVVSCFLEDNDQNIWIGTEDMGVNKLIKSNGSFIKVTESLPANNLSYDNVHDLLMVSENELWIATYSGGINVLNTKTNHIKCYKVSTEWELGSNFIYALTKKDNIVYIGTDQGISTYNINTQKFVRIEKEKLANHIFVSFAWKNEVLWICSYDAIFSYDTKSHQLTQYPKLSKEHTFGQIFIDSKERIWITTNNQGLIHYNESSNEITYYNKKYGFPAKRVFAIEEADNHSIWVSTNQGLLNFNPENNAIIHYDSNSGIPFNQFNFRASFKDSEGIIYFGGNDGMISINPDITNYIEPTSVQLTELMLFNKHISPGNDKPIHSTITTAPVIELDHNQNVITLNYTSLDYTNKGSISYAYKLEGFDEDYNYVGNKNSAIYTNLDPGDYTFLVKASNDAWENESAVKEIKIHINPPIWLTPVAFMFYAIIIISIFLLINNISIKMQQSKAQVALERQERLHNEEINNFKLEFFTNISHELKTPLMLILGIVNKVLLKHQVTPVVRKDLNSVDRSAKRLYKLITQLLDFRKIESGKEKLKVTENNLSSFFEEISSSFHVLAESKNIEFSASTHMESNTYVDLDKIDKIVFNLLSNAFKFTDSNGKISLSAKLQQEKNNKESESHLVIKVKNTGEGIHPDNISKVFNRYFQSGNESNQGSGIGLAYVKSLVELHHGSIEVDSTLNESTAFTVKIPVDNSYYNETELQQTSEQFIHSGNDITITPENRKKDQIETDISTNKPHILIVEDNIELIDFLKESLEEEFRISIAFNGKKALEKLENISPELIISDIMMPEMDGITFTSTIKNDLQYSHIPVILLTSKSGVENKLEGLRTGADYYIEKPFYPELLDQNIKNILKTRQNIIEKYKTDDNMTVEEVVISEADKVFLEKLIHIIKDNLNSPDMDVSFLIHEMSVSRTLLHTKLKKLVGCSSTEFIRSVRLKEAVKMISSGKCNISEAAYETGFSSPQYFAKCFKEFFGKSPRNYFNI